MALDVDRVREIAKYGIPQGEGSTSFTPAREVLGKRTGPDLEFAACKKRLWDWDNSGLCTEETISRVFVDFLHRGCAYCSNNRHLARQL